MATVERGFLLADLTGYTSTSPGVSSRTPRSSPATCWKPWSGGWSPRSGSPSSRATPPSCSPRNARSQPCCSTRSLRRTWRSGSACGASRPAERLDCKACALAPRLDLKAFVHYGDYLRSTIAGRDELSGADVIVAHRLLKGAGAASAVGRGFVLFTAPAAGALGLDTQAGAARRRQRVDRAPGRRRYADPRSRGTLDGRDGGAPCHRQAGTPLFAITVDLDAAPADVWAHLTSPTLRPAWEGPLEITETLVDGMRGVGVPRAASRAGWPPSRRSWTGCRTNTSAGGSPCQASARSRRATTSRRSGGGTRLDVRWRCETPPADAAAAETARHETEAALSRLRQAMGRGIAVPQGRR